MPEVADARMVGPGVAGRGRVRRGRVRLADARRG